MYGTVGTVGTYGTVGTVGTTYGGAVRYQGQGDVPIGVADHLLDRPTSLVG